MTYADAPPRPYRRPYHPGLVAIGSTLLIAAFVTDVVYWQTMLFQWDNFSAWLLVAGLVFAVLAAIAFLVDLVGRRLDGVAWRRFFGVAIAALLSLLNAFVHSRDAYTAVWPEGIVLSTVVAILLIVVGLGGGWSLDARRSTARTRTREVRQ